MTDSFSELEAGLNRVGQNVWRPPYIALRNLSRRAISVIHQASPRFIWFACTNNPTHSTGGFHSAGEQRTAVAWQNSLPIWSSVLNSIDRLV